MKFPCRLEGGPYDGDQGSWTNREELPEQLWAAACGGGSRNCPYGGIHWYPEQPRNHENPNVRKTAEKYVYDRIEGEIAVYVHANVDLSDLPSIHAHEHQPVPT